MLPKYAKPAGCVGCDLEKVGFGFVPPSGPVNAPLLFLGESGGYHEAIEGVPFIGAAGGMFGRILRRSSLERDTVRVDNCVKCRPPEDWLDGAPWEFAAINQCSQYLVGTLNEPHSVIVTLGGTALRTILGLQGVDAIRVQDFHGTVHRTPDDRQWVVPTFHPSHLQRGAINLLDVVRHDLAVAQRLVRDGGYARRPVSLLQDPTTEWFAAWVATYLARSLNDPEGFPLAVDIETNDKAGGRDEGELTADDASMEITRWNFSCNPDEGVTVPDHPAYRGLVAQLLASGGVKYLWNKWYDRARILFHQYAVGGEWFDLMWAAKHRQSDLPLGLGFWAPFFSDYGAWKHLGKVQGREAEYASVDGLQTRRTGDGLVSELVARGLWDAFYRHNHELEQHVLRPAYDVGVLVDKDRLNAFHVKLDRIAGEKLEELKHAEAAGSFRPKAGYANKPKGDPPVPPASILGKKKGKERTSKDEYIESGVQLVERSVEVEIRVCLACGTEAVGPKHRCARPKGQKAKAAELPDVVPDVQSASPTPVLETRRVLRPRWFWQLPFNPDSPQQILRYIKETGSVPGRAKKTRKDTTDKKTLRKLAAQTGDPIYSTILDYKAVKKVDSTYALGTLRRIWTDGRLHPQYTFRPSTFRLSYVNPNIQNVIADKDGKESLAAGFRACVVAAPGCRLLEIDYGGIEAVETGWFCGDPDFVRLATLGVHAFVTSHVIGKPASLAWSDDDLAFYFADIKKSFPLEYDRCKRTVHGKNYGLTIYGMVENFPETFPSLKIAQQYEDLYYTVATKLAPWHKMLRDRAHEHGFLGGPTSDDYGQLVSTGMHHPFGYQHWFWGVLAYVPISAAEYHNHKRQGRTNICVINGRPFKIKYGEDAKRVIAFYPQSTAAGVLKESMLRLFTPDSPSYIGDQYYGKTVLRAPIHDSLLLEIPDAVFDYVASIVCNEMQRPIVEQPCPPEWGRGKYLTIGVSAKVGRDWEAMEKLEVPKVQYVPVDSTLYMGESDEDLDELQDLERRVH